jgi:hypothetical protein
MLTAVDANARAVLALGASRIGARAASQLKDLQDRSAASCREKLPSENIEDLAIEGFEELSKDMSEHCNNQIGIGHQANRAPRRGFSATRIS